MLVSLYVVNIVHGHAGVNSRARVCAIQIHYLFNTGIVSNDIPAVTFVFYDAKI